MLRCGPMCQPSSLRIVLVAHAFPPDSHAGVEQYTARLAGALRLRGHDVAVVTSRQRPGAPQYAVERGEVDGTPVIGIVQNWPYRDLPEAIEDEAVDRVFDRVLADIEPDLVSVQTLAHLSAGLPAVAGARGIPVVAHLHDWWLSCPAGGQRLHPDLGPCAPVDARLCGACFDRYRHVDGPLERAGRWLAGRAPWPMPRDAFHRAFRALPVGAREALRRANEVGARRSASRLAPGRAPGREPRADAPRAPGRGAVGDRCDPRIRGRRLAVREALAHVRHVVSPTRFLLDSLRADGVDLPPAEVIGTGVPSCGPPGPRAERGPLRILFLGTWAPHKGPQVLARALCRLETPVLATAVGPVPFPQFRAEVLALAGGRLRARAQVGPGEVPGLIEEVDAVVVPSIWEENAPLVALEARERGRPVIASRIGGLPELVEDGVDGRLFPPGDDAALAAILRDAAGVRALSETVRQPKSLDTFARETEARYLELAR